MRGGCLRTVPDPGLSVTGQLGSFGPGCACSCSEAEARAYCVGLARAHPENFAVLSRVVPDDLSEDFASVYAFCRWADDLGDEGEPEQRLERLAWWRERLDAMLAGEPDHPVTVALAPTERRHALGGEAFGALIGAFERDQTEPEYATWEGLLSYCAGSANPVGHLVLMMGGLRPPGEDASSGPVWAKSDAVCSALQITNHVQDVRRDLLERGRVYLPAEVTGFGSAEMRAWAARGDDHEARVAFILGARRVVDRARELFVSAEGIERESGRVGAAVWLMREGGRAVLELIEARGCTTLWDRPRLGRLKAMTLGARAMMKRGGS